RGFRRLRVSRRDDLRSARARGVDRRGADHLRGAPGRIVEALGQRHPRVDADALASADAVPLQGAPVTTRHRVVMVATSYPRFPGDTVGTFMEPIAQGVAARGHDVH